MKTALLTVLTSIALSVPAAAQELVATELSSEALSLLEGRLAMNALDGAELEARGHSIMAAAPQNAIESRIRVDAGDERMVIMAYELFASCGPNFGESAATFLAPLADDATVHPVAEAGGLEYVFYTPTQRDLTTEAVHVGTAFVCSADRHVVRVDFLVSPEGTEDMPALERKATEMLDTIEVGERTLDLTERTVVMGDQLLLPVPAGIYHYAQPGPDFSVNYFGEVAALGESGGTVLLYVGGHPSRRHEAEPNVLSTLFGSEVLWSVEERNGRASLEALVPHPVADYTILHILISGQDQESSQNLRIMIEGLETTP